MEANLREAKSWPRSGQLAVAVEKSGKVKGPRCKTGTRGAHPIRHSSSCRGRLAEGPNGCSFVFANVKDRMQLEKLHNGQYSFRRIEQL
jgi:hypothetical protein